MLKQLSERKAWEHLANAFKNADEYGIAEVGSCVDCCLCTAISSMIICGLISPSTSGRMFERIKLLAYKLKTYSGCYLFERGTKRGATLRAGYCREQAKLLTPKAKTEKAPKSVKPKPTTKLKPKTVKTKARA